MATTLYWHDYETFGAGLSWNKLFDEDREEIAAKLTYDMPEIARNDDPARLLRTQLVRKRTLPGLIEELRNEVKRRQPSEPEPQLNSGDAEGEERFAEEVVEADALVESTVIADYDELDSRLASLRKKLTDLLKSNKQIRIKER